MVDLVEEFRVSLSLTQINSVLESLYLIPLYLYTVFLLPPGYQTEGFDKGVIRR